MSSSDADVPIRQSILRSATWQAGSSTAGHRVALILAMVTAAIVLFVLMPRIVH
jgi:hypothetical protein